MGVPEKGDTHCFFCIFFYLCSQEKTLMKRLIGLCFLVFFASCNTGRYQVPGNPTQNITIQRFDKAFYEKGAPIDTAFLNLYANQIMEVGEPGGRMFKQFEAIFRNDKDIQKLYNDCQNTFNDVSDIEEELTWAFFRMHYFFPNIPTPKVYMHIAGFGESIVSAPGIVSAGIDKYLGKDYDVYRNLFDPYQSQRMYPEKLPVDYVTGWLRSEMTEEKLMQDQRLLDYMIYEGKMLFLIRILMPEESMENLTGFTTNQLTWCTTNEKNMWETITQLQHLYSKDPTVVAKYIREAPNTAFFTQESPGKAASWIGFRIVEAYMENNPRVSMQNLILKTKAQDILKGSDYLL
jgi:hypothetical protein